jgi:hypothetical protein
MAAYTSSQSGDWASASTWSGAGVPVDGDTVTIGAHTVTVASNATVGTSPNNTTTIVISLTSASSVLVIAAGVTFTVKGNLNLVNSSTLRQEAGSTVTFDSSSSGGTPVYTCTNVGFTRYVFNGTSGSPCVIQAVTGHRFALSGNWNNFAATWTTFRRCNSPGATNAAGGASGTSITNCTYESCASINITQSSATQPFLFNNNRISASTHSTDSVQINLGTTATAGTRSITGNVMDKQLNLLARNVILDNNVLGGITCYTGGSTSFARNPRNNLIIADGTLNGGNGMRTIGSWDRLYVIIANEIGNPHFLAPNTVTGDGVYTQCVFQAHTPDLVDTGDDFILIGACCASGTRVVAQNCISLLCSYPGTTVQSGQMLTSYTPSASALNHNFQGLRNTVNVDNSDLGSVPPRAAFAVAEAGAGAAGQVSALRSNIAWATSGTQGFLAERISGAVADIITPAQANNNWLHNVGLGDNGRGYDDRGNANMWTAGNAAAAGVDSSQGSGDPQFVDSTRNIEKWCFVRGYGPQNFADAVAAVQADTSRISDLIDYIFEGYKVRNPSMRTSAHDGSAIGASNFHKASRTFAKVSGLRAYANGRYGISV